MCLGFRNLTLLLWRGKLLLLLPKKKVSALKNNIWRILRVKGKSQTPLQKGLKLPFPLLQVHIYRQRNQYLNYNDKESYRGEWWSEGKQTEKERWYVLLNERLFFLFKAFSYLSISLGDDSLILYFVLYSKQPSCVSSVFLNCQLSVQSHSESSEDGC